VESSKNMGMSRLFDTLCHNFLLLPHFALGLTNTYDHYFFALTTTDGTIGTDFCECGTGAAVFAFGFDG